MAPSLLWYDYETFGTDPRRDRIAQFAALRTDLDLQPVDEPLSVYCQPTDDYLPHPQSCLITGITPQLAHREGIPEPRFADLVLEQLARPGTCGVGFNSIRFDDEFTRFLLYRNFHDPYEREWRHGNSRWDVIDMLRLAHALRPEGIEWPRHEDGTPSFRLEHLSDANGLEHARAHDALSDVRATVALARLVRERQPRLYDYVFAHRGKREVQALLDPEQPRPVLHVSSRYPASLGCIAPVLALARHPHNRGEIVVFDLRGDPSPLLEAGAEEIAERVFTPREELGDERRIGLKTVRLNRAPVVVPAGTLSASAAVAWQIDLAKAREHAARLRAAQPALGEKLARVFTPRAEDDTDADPETALYSGGFVDDRDRGQFARVREARDAAAFDAVQQRLHDERLRELVFRRRARHFPATLDDSLRARWEALRAARLTRGAGGARTFEAFDAALAVARSAPASAQRDEILASLVEYRQALADGLAGAG